MVEKKDVEEKVEDIKTTASEKKEDVSDKIKEIKEETQTKADETQEEMEKKKSQTDKLLKDIVKTIKTKQDEFGKTISDYTSPKPPSDVIETTDIIILKIDLPGVLKENIDIGITGEKVEISAKFDDEMEGEDINYIQKERSYGETKKIIKLPSEIKIKEASADFKNCILTIKLPKVQIETHKVNID